MFSLDLWKEISTTLSRNKLRTFLTAWGVFWGVFLLVVMLAVSVALEKGVEAEFFGKGENQVFVWGGKTTLAYQGMKPGRRISYDQEDIPPLENLEGIKYLAPRSRLGGWRGGINVNRKERVGNFNVMADYPDLLKIRPTKLKEGRFINNQDIEEKRKVAVIGPAVYDILFAPGESVVGETLKIKGVFFTIVGHLAKEMDTDSEIQSIHVPFTTYQSAFNGGGRVGWLAMTSKKDVPADVLEKDAKETLKRIHRVHPDDHSAIGSFNAATEVAKIRSIFAGMRFFGWLVGVGTLLMGILGVSNIMLISVKERTQELGIRKALGATPGVIVSQILQETLVLTSMPGYLGIVFSVFLLESVSPLLEKSTPLGELHGRVDVALVALLILVLAGLFAGYMPARYATKISPIEALRS